MENVRGDGGAGVRRRLDDSEAVMEAGVAVAPSASPVTPHLAAAYAQIDAMYLDARVDNIMLSSNDDMVPFWEDNMNEQPEVNHLFEYRTELVV